MTKPLSPLAYSVRKTIERYNLIEKNFVLSISGGKDSMALLYVFLELKTVWRELSLQVFHVHHGQGATKKYRDEAQKRVADICQQEGLSFLTNSHLPMNLNSEEDFRHYRQNIWKELRPSNAILVTAHHQQDLLETRFHRLLRGTGIQGLIGMEEWKNEIFRPFLNIAENEIICYSKKHNILFSEDPSNQDPKYFRNWLRHQLLPQIESYQAGGLESLRQSLEQIAGLWDEKESFLKTWFVNEKIKRQAFLLLDQTHQLQLLAYALQKRNINQYRRSQLEEVLKMLDRRQNEYTFEMIGCQWKVNSESVEISVLD